MSRQVKFNVKLTKLSSSPSPISLILIVSIILSESISSILEEEKSSISTWGYNSAGSNNFAGSEKTLFRGLLIFASAKQASLPSDPDKIQVHKKLPFNGSMFGKRSVGKSSSPSIKRSDVMMRHEKGKEKIIQPNFQSDFKGQTSRCLQSQMYNYEDIITEMTENFLDSRIESGYSGDIDIHFREEYG